MDIQLYDALKKMRAMSRKEGSANSFSFSFMSYSRTRRSTQGLIEVRHARLKRRAQEANFENADIIEEYIDLDIGESKRFYQCTLMTFNGHKIRLS
ncbi:MAG: hypothetical protein ABJG41_01370 [Cyclobacteriaceae bacterium]